MSYNGDCRTAPATPGLLNMTFRSSDIRAWTTAQAGFFLTTCLLLAVDT